MARTTFIFSATASARLFGLAHASARLFGLAHASSSWLILTLSVPIAASGFIFAYVCARTHDYFSVVLAHGLGNAFVVVLAFASHSYFNV